MAYEGFLSLGGTEIANAARTKAYADELVPLLGLSDCWGCADLAEVLGHGPYTTPIVDRPDWFADHDPDSWDFAGFYPLEIEGLEDGVREASVTELALDGAVVGAPRYRSREIRVSGLLIGASAAAVSYGMSWLAKALEGAPCREAASCTGDHLCFYSACPPMCSDSPALDDYPGGPVGSRFYLCDGGLVTTTARACSVDYERTLYQVTTTSGPTIVERFNSVCGSMVRVEFTMVAGVPFAFSTAISAVPGLQPIPNPQITPEVSCAPGGQVPVRTNLATNPVPVGNAAEAGGGWLADGDEFTVAVDPEVTRLDGDASVRVARAQEVESPNLAPNPEPAGDLAGWGWRRGQSAPGPVRSNLVENPWPRAVDGRWVYTVPGDGTGPYTRQLEIIPAGAFTRTNLHINPRLQGASVAGAGAPAGADQATGGPDGGPWRQITIGETVPSGDTHIGHTAALTVQVEPGSAVPYQITSQAYRSAGGTARMSVRRLDAGGTQVGADVDLGVTTLQPGTWTQLAGVYHAAVNPTVTSIIVRVVFGEAKTAGDVLGASQVMVERASTVGGYFDGDTPDTDVAAYGWTGAANASTSTATTAPVPSTGPDDEPGFARHTQDAGDEQAWTITYTSDQSLGAGVAYTASVYVRSTSARSVTFGGRQFDLPEAGWARLSVQGAAAGGPLVLTVAGQGQVAGDTLDVARALVEADAPLGSYFDGQTPGGAGLQYEWTGAADASPSLAVLQNAAVTTELAAGDGPAGQTTFQRTTITVPKAGGEDGPTYTLSAGEGTYSTALQVRPSAAVNAALRVSALAPDGTLLTSSVGPVTALRAGEWSTLGPVPIAAPQGTARLQVAALMPGGEVLPYGETVDAGAVRVVAGLLMTDPLLGRVTYLGQHDDTASTIEVHPGGVYTASVFAGANTGALGTLSVQFYDAAGGGVGDPVTGPPVGLEAVITTAGISQWNRAWVTASAPDGAAFAVVSIEIVKDASGATLADAAWLTSMLFEQSGAVLSYFDGATSDTDTMSYQWTGTQHASTSQALLTIPAVPGPIVDPDCPPIPPPPRPPLINVSCVDVPEQWRRYVVQVGEDLVPVWRDAVPIIRLQTAGTSVHQVRVRFYPNPLGAPVGALDPCDYCGEFVVTYIPPDSLMVIDGIRQWASITGNRTGEVSTANHLLASSDGGPVQWPLLGCGVGYTLVVDVSPIGVSDLTPQICLAARS